MSKQKTTSLPAVKFQIGDKVQVRHGIMDSDFPDIPIGGWAGTIAWPFFCEARRDGQVVTIPLGLLKNVKDKASRKLIDDHSYWFNNWS